MQKSVKQYYGNRAMRGYFKNIFYGLIHHTIPFNLPWCILASCWSRSKGWKNVYTKSEWLISSAIWNNKFKNFSISHLRFSATCLIFDLPTNGLELCKLKKTKNDNIKCIAWLNGSKMLTKYDIIELLKKKLTQQQSLAKTSVCSDWTCILVFTLITTQLIRCIDSEIWNLH